MKIVLTGGGSAGHTVPHLTILERLKEQFTGIYYIGGSGIEKQIISKANLAYYEIPTAKLIRSFTLKNLKLPFVIIKSIRRCIELLKELKPDVVFSKGGYVAFPVVYAAHSLKIPVVSHESDLSVGLANKMSARYSKAVLTSFKETAEKIKNGVYSGPPIHSKMFTAGRENAKNFYKLNNSKKTLLVLGGGSGSRIINQTLRKALPSLLSSYNVLHLCGKGNISNLSYTNYIQIEFESDMSLPYACADLVVCRAGSNTCFEVIMLKKPTLFIPLSKAASRGDQIENALYFKDKGLANVLRQEELNENSLIKSIAATVSDGGLLNALKNNKIPVGNIFIVNTLIKQSLKS